MDKLASQIGERVKRLRVSYGMTQSELSGSYMTRNMLSRIENGAALPSLPTVVYLAERLKVNPAYFLSEKEDFLSMKKETRLTEIRRIFGSGEYAKCYSLYKSEFLDECDDEIAYMMAHCSLYEAMRMLRSGNMQSAGKELSVTESFLTKTVFPTDDIRARVILARAVIENPSAPLLALDECDYITCVNVKTNFEFFAYLSENSGFPYQNALFARHLSARALMKKKEYQNALTILTELEEERNSTAMSAYLLFKIYSDAEICHKELRNFEAAYRYSTRRMSLFTSFNM